MCNVLDAARAEGKLLYGSTRICSGFVPQGEKAAPSCLLPLSYISPSCLLLFS